MRLDGPLVTTFLEVYAILFILTPAGRFSIFKDQSGRSIAKPSVFAG